MHLDFTINVSRDDRGTWHATAFLELESGQLDQLSTIGADNPGTALNYIAWELSNYARQLDDREELEAQAWQEA